MKFRKHNTLLASIEPLIKGEQPTRKNCGMAGPLHIMASGPICNGFFRCSIWDEIDNKYFIVELTKTQIIDIEKNDGIELIFID
jgi:hypothetical protein